MEIIVEVKRKGDSYIYISDLIEGCVNVRVQNSDEIVYALKKIFNSVYKIDRVLSLNLKGGSDANLYQFGEHYDMFVSTDEIEPTEAFVEMSEPKVVVSSNRITLDDYCKTGKLQFSTGDEKYKFRCYRKKDEKDSKSL